MTGKEKKQEKRLTLEEIFNQSGRRQGDEIKKYWRNWKSAMKYKNTRSAD